MKALILGDVHGCWEHLNICIARAFVEHPDITHMVQVGDFGYAWPGSKPFKLSTAFMPRESINLIEKVPFYWLDGNHENHDRLEKDNGSNQPNMIYQPRGSIQMMDGRRAMFFGGASSIDKDQRIEGASWWPQESIKYGQVVEALKQPGPIDIIFSHEHPIAFNYSNKYKGQFGLGDKMSLDAIRQHFKPRFYVFGHHHDFGAGIDDGTHWACAPCIEHFEAILWNGERLERLYLDS